VTLVARRTLRVAGQLRLKDVRLGRIAISLGISLGLLALALAVPPFIPPGADLTDSGQRAYARNIWQETQTSLGLVSLVLPWLVYGLLWQGAPWGRRLLLGLATAAVVVTTWLTLQSAQSYAALPREVTGVVDHVDGRTIWMQGGARYYLVLSDVELQSAQGLLRPGNDLVLWVSPRGHAGAVVAARG
jgi:hypothetical protein